MEAIRELFSQVAAECKMRPASAKKVIYLMTLAADGADMARAKAALKVVEGTVQGWCRKFDICLADYDPYPPDRFPVRPRPPQVIKAHGAESGNLLFGTKEKRRDCAGSHSDRQAHGGKVYCRDCGREVKPPKAGR
jgi:hypothetical protein